MPNVINFTSKPVAPLWSPGRKVKASWRLLSTPSVIEFHVPSEPVTLAIMGEMLLSTVKPGKRPVKVKRERSPAEEASGLTFQPTKQRFKGTNVVFSLETQEAYSYNWWRFVERIGPYLVFNTYNYSATTNKHQWSLKSLLCALDLTIDFKIEAPDGLQSLESATRHYQREIEKLEAAIAVKGSHKAKNEQRRAQITKLQVAMGSVSMLIDLKNQPEERKA